MTGIASRQMRKPAVMRAFYIIMGKNKLYFEVEPEEHTVAFGAEFGFSRALPHQIG